MTIGSPIKKPGAPICVLVATIGGPLPTVVSQLIARQRDLVVGQVQEPIELLAAGAGADVVVFIAEQTTHLPGLCTHLLSEYPQLRIVVLGPGGTATLFWLGLRKRRLPDTRPQAVVEGIRKAYCINPAQ